MNKVKEEQTPLGLVLYRNAMSLPLLLMIMAIKGDSLTAPFTDLLPPTFYTTLALSSVFSFSIGFAVFMLQTEVRVAHSPVATRVACSPATPSHTHTRTRSRHDTFALHQSSPRMIQRVHC